MVTDGVLIGLLAAALFSTIGLLGTALFQLRGDIAKVQGEIAELRAEIIEVRADLGAQIAELRGMLETHLREDHGHSL